MRVTVAISDAVRSRLSMRSRRKLAERRVQLRKFLAKHRVLPDFLIIGGQRCGTSSLYRYLGEHPDLISSLRKETRYFSTRFFEGEDWYRAHFSLRARVELQTIVRGARPLSFEATPDYLFHPQVPSRVWQTLPDARFVVLLRDPVERAFSHYKHMRRLRLEGLSFEEAISREEERISHDLQRLLVDPLHPMSRALRFSYVSRGRYPEQLERWLKLFSRNRFLILDSQELFEQPDETIARICSFLGVQSRMPSTFKNYSGKPPPEYELVERRFLFPMHVRDSLRQQFSGDNEELIRLTGRTFTWM